MDIAKQPSGEPLLTTAELAAMADFTLGGVIVSPSTRSLRGPGGGEDLEPRVMQVLVVLAGAAGQVVTRETLFNRCWGGVYVGDDSLNRAVAALRRAIAAVAGRFEVETIPRTGYRLIGDVMPASSEAGAPAMPRGIDRRAIVVGALAAVGLSGAGLWWNRSREQREYDALLESGEQALDYGDSRGSNPIEYFRQAAAIRPDDARTLGLLAYSLTARAENTPSEAAVPVQEAERTALAALAIAPRELNAQLAITQLRRSMLDMATFEDRVRAILAANPNNTLPMRELWNFLQCAGRSRDAFAMVERAGALKPLAASNNFPRAQLLWILGRNAEADRVIDRAMEYWPAHRYVRFARFTIFAFTDRPQAALAMIESEETRPQHFTPAMVSLWRACLTALDQRTPASIANAKHASLVGAKRNLALSYQAVMVLAALGEVDAAFELTDALFAVRHPDGRAQPVNRGPPAKSTACRFAPWLFTPPVASLRADPRFEALCEDIGLSAYWKLRGIKPDYQLDVA